jgi:hypothetical protein
MSAFDECRKLEDASRRHLQQHLLRELVYDGRFVRVEKGPMAREFQLTSGDYLWNSDELTAWRVEHKCEYANTYGNLFLETFSNKSRGKLGWFFTNGADLLLYHFLRSGEVLLLRLAELRMWAYQHENYKGVMQPRVHRYKERDQARYDQMNDTWGYCVNVAHIEAGMWVRRKAVPELLLPEYEERLTAERSVRSGTDDLFRGGL